MSNFLNIILWFQAAFAVWQFFRETKFLRIPYVLLSSLWNDGIFSVFNPQSEYLTFDESFGTTGEISLGMSSEQFESDFKEFQVVDVENVKFKIGEKQMSYHTKSFHMMGCLYMNMIVKKKIVVEKSAELIPGVFLCKKICAEDAFLKCAKGKAVYYTNNRCVIDQSSSDYLNQNFLRLMSITPLILQAKNLNLLSIIMSSILIFLDLTSYISNHIWLNFIKFPFIKYLKLLISLFPVEIRVITHYLLATGSDKFLYCDTSLKKSYFKKIKTHPVVYRGRETYGLNFEKYEIIEGPSRFSLTYEINNVIFKITANEEAVPLMMSRSNLNCITLESEGVKVVKKGVDSNYIQRVLLLMGKCYDNQLYPILEFDNGSAHLVNPLEVVNVFDNNFSIYDFDSRRYFISDFSLVDDMDLRLWSVLKIEEDIKTLLFRHNINFFKGRSKLYLIHYLHSSKSSRVRPKDIGNSQWKRYTSDFNIILKNMDNSFIKSVTQKPASKTLLGTIEECKKLAGNGEDIIELGSTIKNKVELTSDKLEIIVKPRSEIADGFWAFQRRFSKKQRDPDKTWKVGFSCLADKSLNKKHVGKKGGQAESSDKSIKKEKGGKAGSSKESLEERLKKVERAIEGMCKKQKDNPALPKMIERRDLIKAEIEDLKKKEEGGNSGARGGSKAQEAERKILAKTKNLSFDLKGIKPTYSEVLKKGTNPLFAIGNDNSLINDEEKERLLEVFDKNKKIINENNIIRMEMVKLNDKTHEIKDKLHRTINDDNPQSHSSPPQQILLEDELNELIQRVGRMEMLKKSGMGKRQKGGVERPKDLDIKKKNAIKRVNEMKSDFIELKNRFEALTIDDSFEIIQNKAEVRLDILQGKGFKKGRKVIDKNKVLRIKGKREVSILVDEEINSLHENIQEKERGQFVKQDMIEKTKDKIKRLKEERNINEEISSTYIRRLIALKMYRTGWFKMNYKTLLNNKVDVVNTGVFLDKWAKRNESIEKIKKISENFDTIMDLLNKI